MAVASRSVRCQNENVGFISAPHKARGAALGERARAFAGVLGGEDRLADGGLLREAVGWMIMAQSPITPFIGDDRPSGGKQFVAIASPLLSSPLARGYEVEPGQTVKSVNGKTFANFREFVQLLVGLKDEFVVFEFNESGCERVVFKRSEVEAATEKLMDSNGIRRQCSKDVRDICEKD